MLQTRLSKLVQNDCLFIVAAETRLISINSQDALNSVGKPIGERNQSTTNQTKKNKTKYNQRI